MIFDAKPIGRKQHINNDFSGRGLRRELIRESQGKCLSQNKKFWQL